MSDKKTKRIQIEFDEAALVEIDEIMTQCGLLDPADLMRASLGLLNWAAIETMKGLQIASIDHSQETYSTLEMPIFDNLREFVKNFEWSPPSCRPTQNHFPVE